VFLSIIVVFLLVQRYLLCRYSNLSRLNNVHMRDIINDNGIYDDLKK